jgi:hypothetical protein
MSKPTSHYVDNKKFLEAIIDHRKKTAEAKSLGKEPPRLSRYLGECILLIAQRLSYNREFVAYTFKEEMISDGIENVIQYFHNFDPERGKNPFAYFTQIIYHAFVRRINKEEKQRYTAYKHFQESVMIPERQGDLVFDMENGPPKHQLYENITEFMDRFEKKEKDKKIKRGDKKKDDEAPKMNRVSTNKGKY